MVENVVLSQMHHFLVVVGGGVIGFGKIVLEKCEAEGWTR